MCSNPKTSKLRFVPNSASPFLLDAGGFSGTKPQFSTILFATDLHRAIRRLSLQCNMSVCIICIIYMYIICMFMRWYWAQFSILTSPSLPAAWPKQDSKRLKSLPVLQVVRPSGVSRSSSISMALWKTCDVFSKICRAGSISLAISWPVPPQSEPLQQVHHLAPCRFWSRTAATTITNAQWIWQRQQQQQANNNKKRDDKDNDNENSSSYSLSIHKLQCPQVEQEGDMLPEGETSICKFPFAVPVAPSVVGNQCSWGDLRSYSGPYTGLRF